MGLEGIRVIEACLPGLQKRSPPPPPPAPFQAGGECSHDGFGKDSFVLKQAGMAFRSGGVGGGGGGGGSPPPPHLQIQCSHDRLGQDSLAEKRAGTVLKKGGLGGAQPSLHRLQTQCFMKKGGCRGRGGGGRGWGGNLQNK